MKKSDNFADKHREGNCGYKVFCQTIGNENEEVIHVYAHTQQKVMDEG